ncbi:hypothetical protein KC347_g50 [Hortaea werneckii]|nr:hypothetical protein KC347_g50 [Hortaea werneckii]
MSVASNNASLYRLIREVARSTGRCIHPSGALAFNNYPFLMIRSYARVFNRMSWSLTVNCLNGWTNLSRRDSMAMAR